jgi:hypothetical protein
VRCMGLCGLLWCYWARHTHHLPVYTRLQSREIEVHSVYLHMLQTHIHTQVQARKYVCMVTACCIAGQSHLQGFSPVFQLVLSNSVSCVVRNMMPHSMALRRPYVCMPWPWSMRHAAVRTQCAVLLCAQGLCCNCVHLLCSREVQQHSAASFCSLAVYACLKPGVEHMSVLLV